MNFTSKQAPRALTAVGLASLLVLTLGPNCLQVDPAWAVTAAEKRAEADSVYAQIDSLQTSLNDVMAQHDEAEAAHEEAVALADEAAAQIEAETQRIQSLQGELSSFAVGMYKEGSAGTFIDVLLQTTSFEQFMTSLDFCTSVSDRGSSLIRESKEARQRQEEAKAAYDEQSERAAQQMRVAEEAAAQIEDTQSALRSEASKLSQEADELQVAEELAAEAARQAEEARKQREAEIAAARQAAQSASYSVGASVQMGSGFFTNPCPEATSSSGFGYRTFDHSFHKGTDMAAPEGTPYYAADDGTVMYATNDGGYNGGAGNWIVISHGNGIVTKYMHSAATFVRPGDHVTRGQNIGIVGNTGQSFGAHLHFQVEVDGVAVNPHNYI